MPRPDDMELLEQVARGELLPSEFILANIDRSTGFFRAEECRLLDYKEKLGLPDERPAGELARDVLAFSNTSGGLLIFGVKDSGEALGHPPIDPRAVREALGPYLGTRVDFEAGNGTATVRGRSRTFPFVLVHRSLAAYPTLLRKEIKHRPALAVKAKYLRGSLFYRDGNETRVEPTGGEIDNRASELGFRGAAPRTRSSFVLEEDRPGVRLYAHINDRFVGRQEDRDELLCQFEGGRGRGVSLAGPGGIGKTELAIELVQRLYRARGFRSVYSGSAKRSLLGPYGPQETDPFFSDLPTFLHDLGAWLGLDLHAATNFEMENACLTELSRQKKPLLFVDNLETVDDGRVFQFLDMKLPPNVWLLTTARVHRVRNYVYQKTLQSLTVRDAGQLLRHELKRQGLQHLADRPIEALERYAENLIRHPLMIRWFAWACRRDITLWDKGPVNLPRDEVESFCVGQTLSALAREAQMLVCAAAIAHGRIDVDAELLGAISEVSAAHIDDHLYELETAGLIQVRVSDETGRITYSVSPLAMGPARELARRNHWEQDLARGLRESTQATSSEPASPNPLVRDLLEFDGRNLIRMERSEIRDIEQRIDRANARPHPYTLELFALKAECNRHSGNIVTADDLYRTAADQLLHDQRTKDPRAQRILLEAATVAKAALRTEAQLRRAIRYLEAIEQSDFNLLRVLGTLAELHALLGEGEAFKAYASRARNLLDQDRTRFSISQVNGLEDGLHRGEDALRQGRPARHKPKEGS